MVGKRIAVVKSFLEASSAEESGALLQTPGLPESPVNTRFLTPKKFRKPNTLPPTLPTGHVFRGFGHVMHWGTRLALTKLRGSRVAGGGLRRCPNS